MEDILSEDLDYVNLVTQVETGEHKLNKKAFTKFIEINKSALAKETIYGTWGVDISFPEKNECHMENDIRVQKVYKMDHLKLVFPPLSVVCLPIGKGVAKQCIQKLKSRDKSTK